MDAVGIQQMKHHEVRFALQDHVTSCLGPNIITRGSGHGAKIGVLRTWQNPRADHFLDEERRAVQEACPAHPGSHR